MEAKIKTWMQTIFPTQGNFLKLKTLADILPIADKFSSDENIFLILYNKGYISAHKQRVSEFKEALESGISNDIHFNITFHITENGILLLNDITDEPIIDNQLKLDL